MYLSQEYVFPHEIRTYSKDNKKEMLCYAVVQLHDLLTIIKLILWSSVKFTLTLEQFEMLFKTVIPGLQKNYISIADQISE